MYNNHTKRGDPFSIYQMKMMYLNKLFYYHILSERYSKLHTAITNQISQPLEVSKDPIGAHC